MSNTTNRPAPDCDHAGYVGCTSCGCTSCGALVDRETLRPLTLPSGRVVYACAACMAEGAEDTGGVPVEVPEDDSCARTVRLESDPSIRETGRGWAEKLLMMEVA